MTGKSKPLTLAWFLIEQEGAVLVVHQKDDGSIFAGQWTLPGDFARRGESAVDAISRFAREELGVVILGEEFLATVPILDSGDIYEARVYRVGYEGQLRYGSSGPFSEVAWATDTLLPSPIPSSLSALLRRLLASGPSR